jgi:orotidine-5'-phosphate decarboxylase
MFKVGSELFTAEGPVPVRYLVTTGRSVFLDLKFHDIPNTVRAAAREAAELGVSMVNVHASGGRKMMEAALEGARSAGAVVGDEARPKVLAVTILTSLESRDLEELGISGTPVEAVIRMARLAQSAGLDGVVASPREISAIRQACGPGFLIVTPGIRPASALHHPVRGSAATDDQARIATPASAILAGADYLVVGRPITGAPDPVAAADAIVAEMEEALGTARHSCN